MMMPRIIAVFTLSAAFAPAVETERQHGVRRTVYATVTQGDAKLVPDMRVEDFELRESGRVQEIAVRPATNPLRVALIVSDRGGGQFQTGALRFCEALLGHGEIAITGIVVQPELLTDFTSSSEALRGALLRLGRRSTAPDAGTQLVEAVVDAAKVVRRAGSRPAIVVIRAGGEATTPLASGTVRNAIRASGAVMYVVAPAGVDRGGMRSNLQGESVTVVTSVLGDSTRDSGGRQIDVAANTITPVMQQVASELISQYEITYTLPPGVKPNERVTVTTTRKGVRVWAPTRVAD